MRDRIVRLLGQALRLLTPSRSEPGRHTAEHLTRPDPWRQPWTSPTKEQAQAILHAREQATRPRRKLYILPPGTYLPLPPGLLRR
ncbi:hypothetical protein ACFXG1_11420 [Streptomyces sp. NPDC059248]|uniref:hypothetical protein n=1 Tax=Streptomyces sp. NPDC059248 TaxID=3346791 RepID=UPI00369BAB8A